MTPELILLVFVIGITVGMYVEHLCFRKELRDITKHNHEFSVQQTECWIACWHDQQELRGQVQRMSYEDVVPMASDHVPLGSKYGRPLKWGKK